MLCSWDDFCYIGLHVAVLPKFIRHHALFIRILTNDDPLIGFLFFKLTVSILPLHTYSGKSSSGLICSTPDKSEVAI